MKTTLKCILLAVIAAISHEAAALDLDVPVLEQMLQEQRYQDLGATLDRFDEGDARVMAWLRSHADEWHPPLLQRLSLLLLKEGSRKPSKEIYEEIVAAYAKAKTAFYIDRGDCKALTSTVKRWNESMDMTATVVEGSLRPTPQAMFNWGAVGFEWLATVSPKRGGATPPPAAWFCGKDNIVEETGRGTARAKRAQELAQQLLFILQQETPAKPR